MKKDVEFSGDIQDIKTKADRDVTKITQQLTQLQSSFDKEQHESPEGTIAASIIELGSQLK